MKTTAMLIGALSISGCAGGEDGREGAGQTSLPNTTIVDTTGGDDTLPPMGTSGSTSMEDDTFGCPLVTYYPDADEDGFGDDAFPVDACLIPPAHVEVGGDCDDTNPDVHPSVEEACNGIDDDCDGLTDEASPANASCQGCALVTEGSHAYYVCPQMLSWDAAQAHCTLFAADLVQVEDQAEQDFLLAQALTGPSVFIGLNDIEVEDQFVWVDGSAPGFTAWGEGEPNDALRGEDCTQLALATGLWNDIACATAAAFVCESVAP